MTDPILVGLAERVKALEISLDINLRTIEGRLAALEAKAAEQDKGRMAQDLRELEALRRARGRSEEPSG